MIVLDTSVLIDLVAGPDESATHARVHKLIDARERLVITTVVLYEFLRGSRKPEHIASQEDLFPLENVLVFGVPEAQISATLYRSVNRARGREMDIAIAASAISRDAAIWTLNPADFKDLPGVSLLSAE